MLGEASKAQVIYRSDAVHPRHQANFRVFDPMDFLAEVSAHIPDSHEKTTLFCGWYSNRPAATASGTGRSRKPKPRTQPPMMKGRECPWRYDDRGRGCSARSTRSIRYSVPGAAGR